MSRFVRMFACVTAAAVSVVQAADSPDQLEFRQPAAIVEPPPGPEFNLWGEFKSSFVRHVQDESIDQFHPLTVLNWNLRPDALNLNEWHSRRADAMGQAISKSIWGALGDATADLPIVTWLEDRQEFLMGLLESSIGNSGEEAVTPLSTGYRPAERSWWKSMSDSGRIHYGIRPFRADPYAYVSLGIKDGNRMLMLWNARYHYVNFADHSFELALSLPLREGLSVDLGTSYRFGQHDEAKRVALKISKEFKGGSILHLGVELRERPSVIAGITIPM